MLDKGALQPMSGAERLNGGHARALDLRERDQTRVHRCAIDQDRAGATLPFAAAFLGARETAVLTEHIKEALQRVRVETPRPAVESEPHESMIFSGVAGISRRSTPA